MSLRLTSLVLLIGLSSFAARTAEAAFALTAQASPSFIETFRTDHPIVMVFANMGILALALVLCAVVFAVLAKGRNDF